MSGLHICIFLSNQILIRFLFLYWEVMTSWWRWGLCLRQCEEGGCVAGWARGLCYFGRLQSWWATYCFGKLGQLGEGVVCSLRGRRLRRWLGTRIVLIRSPSVQMGNILFLEVLTSWWRCGQAVSGGKEVASLAGPLRVLLVAFSPDEVETTWWRCGPVVNRTLLFYYIKFRIIFNLRN
jgi:hypothetical protein